MCKIKDEGPRCAAHTRPFYKKIIDELDGTPKMQRNAVRNKRRQYEEGMLQEDEQDVAGEEYMTLRKVIEHASTPKGRDELLDDIERYKAEGDYDTSRWLSNALSKGIEERRRREQYLEEQRLIKRAERKEAEKEKRSQTMSASALKKADPKKLEKYSLASEYPDIASEWHPDNVDADGNPIGPGDILPYANARAKWRCENGHEWEARINNRTNRSRDGRPAYCPECSGRRQKSLEKLQTELEKYVAAVQGDPEAWEALPAALRHSILSETGMLSGGEDSFNRTTAMEMLNGGLTLEEVRQAKLADNLYQKMGELDESDEELIDRELTADEIAATVSGASNSEQARGSFEDRLDRIMAGSGAANLVANNEVLAERIVSSQVEALWNEAYDNPDRVDDMIARANAAGTKGEFQKMTAERFEAEINAARNMEMPEGYSPRRILEDGSEEMLDPSLLQRRFAMKVEENRRMHNWSGTGSGKTLSAVIASGRVNAEDTVVFCPLSTVDMWKDEFEQAYPGIDVRLDMPSPGESLTSPDGRRRVWILNYDKASAKGEKVTGGLGALADKADMVVFDEVHMVKETVEGQGSLRRSNLGKFMERAGEANPNLAVVGQSATPVVNNLHEAKSLLTFLNGKEAAQFATKPTVKNASMAYQYMSKAGLRWMPSYRPSVEKTETVVDVSQNLEKVAGRIQRMQAASGSKRIDASMMERALMPEKIPAIIDAVKKADGPSVIYSEYTTGMIEPLMDALQGEGLRVARFTGSETKPERKAILAGFQRGEYDVIVGSRPIATGVNGLHRVCRNMIVASPPWTAAQDDQLVGRLMRTGQKRNVKINYIVTEAEADGNKWSWCKDRLNRISYKRSLSDAATDGVMPGGSLESASSAMSHSLKALGKLSGLMFRVFDSE